MRLVLLCTLLFLQLAKPVLGQPLDRAQKFLFKAQSYKAKKDTALAYRCALLAIKENPGFAEAYNTLGIWYYDAKKFTASARIFALAAMRCAKGKERFSLPASRSYLAANMPDSALYWMSLSKSKNKEVPGIVQQANRSLAMRTPPDTNQVRKLNTRINSKFPDFCPSLSADKQSLYFTRRVNGVNEDFFVAHPDSCGGWFTARNMGYPPNTPANESSQTISSDDHYLFFMRSDNRSENGWARGGCDLYLAYRTTADSPWSVPESFGATINTPAFEGMPSLSPDIHDLYFVSNRPGGYGGLDIWVAHFHFGLWQMPVNLGPEINTPGNETAPFISSDNKTLYFASTGHPGLGGSDLFVSKMSDDKKSWSAAVNLGVPINSSADDHSIFVCPNGTETYFASDRNNADGDLDIYETTIPAAFAPASTAFTMCYVIDSLNKEPALVGSITLYDAEDNELAQYHANKGDGSILMSLPVGQAFRYEVRGYNYEPLNGSMYFSEPCPKWCEYRFPLLSKNYVRPTYDTALLTVHFAKNVISLQDSQLLQIQNVLLDWRDKKDISIFVNGYTDNTGTPMINIQKSTIRANVIAETIHSLGFDYSIITATGFGDESPLAPNDSPENQDLNRRVEIVLRYQ